MRRLWLSRPQADSARMAEALAARGIDSLIAPVLTIKPYGFLVPKFLPDALMLTSRHTAMALMSLSDRWRKLPVYCVGPATTRIAHQHGFYNTITGRGTATSLVPRLLATRRSGQRVLHLCGDEVRTNLTPILMRYGITLERLIVYRAAASETLPPTLLHALGNQQLSGAVFYSPRSIAIATQLLKQHGSLPAMASLDAYCLSLAVAEEASALGCRSLHIAEQPSHQAMMELLFESAISGA
jgi:uroporphyrinogen-III synthase